MESVFQALSEPTRLRIVRLLADTDEEVCLCELVDSLHETSYNVSRHLKVLRQAGLLEAKKDGRWVYHRLHVAEPHLTHLLNAVRAIPDPNRLYAIDRERFRKRLCLREDGRCRVGSVGKESRAALSR